MGMNGRPERIDGRLEYFSEPNYASIDFFFSEERRRKWKKRGKDALLLGGLFIALCVIIEGFGRGL